MVVQPKAGQVANFGARVDGLIRRRRRSVQSRERHIDVRSTVCEDSLFPRVPGAQYDEKRADNDDRHEDYRHQLQTA